MIDHLSYSSISTYLNCGRAWKYRYVEEAAAQRTASLVYGSAVHTAIKLHKTTGVALLEAWDMAWSQAVQGDVNWQEKTPKPVYSIMSFEDINWQDETPEALYNAGVRMLTHEDVISTLDSLTPATIQGVNAIEYHVSFNVPGVPVPIVGYVDMIARPCMGVDFKTAGRSWTQERADKDLQSLFYVAALHQMGIVTLPAQFEYIVFVKLKTPKVQRFTVTKTAEDVWWLFRLIADAYNAIQGEAYMPNGVGSWMCSPRYCGFYSDCMPNTIKLETIT